MILRLASALNGEIALAPPSFSHQQTTAQGPTSSSSQHNHAGHAEADRQGRRPPRPCCGQVGGQRMDPEGSSMEQQQKMAQLARKGLAHYPVSLHARCRCPVRVSAVAQQKSSVELTPAGGFLSRQS